MEEKLLSICIPTYNRAAYLADTLNSIISQDNNKIEIVISDNASTDNTEEGIGVFLKQYDFIKYVKNETNVGADLNYYNVVNNAAGKYCVIFGSDDILLAGSLHELCQLLELNSYEYVFFNRKHGKVEETANPEYTFNDQSDALKYLNRQDESFKKYFNSCQMLAGVFSYISNVVFKRRLWDAFKPDGAFVGTAYLHVYFHFKVFLNYDLTVYYHNKVFVFSRADNDSFMQNFAQRFLLDFEGYLKLSKLFGSKDLQYALMQILRRDQKQYDTNFLIWLINMNDYQYRTRILNYVKYYQLPDYSTIAIFTNKMGRFLYRTLKGIKTKITSNE